MSLKLFIDEDSLSKPLVKLLRKAGHDVFTVNEVGLSGKSDLIVLNYARETGRIIVTHNCKDFENLHKQTLAHPGIFAIRNDSNYSKNMSRQAIVKAIANLEAASMSLANQFISLNHWNY